MKHRHRDDDDDIVQDGEHLRVPMTLMDSVQRAVTIAGAPVRDGQGGTSGLHRPGFRIAVTDARKSTVRDPRGGDDDCPECEGTGLDQYGEECQACSGTGYEPSAEEVAGNATTTARRLDSRQINRDHQQRMARLYSAYDSAIREAWRGDK